MTANKTFTFEGFLTKEQFDFFNQHGYIHFENHIPVEITQEVVPRDEPRQRGIRENRLKNRKLGWPFRKSIGRAIDLSTRHNKGIENF
jgi:hypothetical protein